MPRAFRNFVRTGSALAASWIGAVTLIVLMQSITWAGALGHGRALRAGICGDLRRARLASHDHTRLWSDFSRRPRGNVLYDLQPDERIPFNASIIAKVGYITILFRCTFVTSRLAKSVPAPPRPASRRQDDDRKAGWCG